MGLLKKMKDILFDEEEVIEEKVVTKEVKKPEAPTYTEYKPPVVNREANLENSKSIEEESVVKNVKPENTFPFPDFDEDEFDNMRPVQKAKPRTTTNVMDYERNKRRDKKTDFSRLEKVETTDKKKFKPSPIISPVYGILNEDYTADDITNRGEKISLKKELDVESVRKKAFGTLEGLTKKENYKEPEIVKSFEPEEEKQQKVKTIDELLEDTSDVKINMEDTDEIDIPSEIPETLNEVEPRKVELDENEDTLENDLFDLIDSMYDTREDGE